MTRWQALLVILVAFSLLPGRTARAVAPPAALAERVANAVTELDLEGARRLLEKAEADSPALSFERARFALYLGDCDAASAVLSSPLLAGAPQAAPLAELAGACARATAGATLVERSAEGISIRLQDERDRVLVPFIADIASRARAAVRRDLGVELPRPLRIDLVRDLFSLSAVSGLPLTAAETTGTVAVARWGRVTMISPRATALGYPWEDTLAHEITHLALSRATRDAAPLWLQEGIAKRQETRWRSPRPFDDDPNHDRVAREALRAGKSVGIDQLGPSIAMLPTPDAASIAFSEVASFVAYWIGENGDAALRLLFADLRGLGAEGTDQALRSVSGYDLTAWVRLWQNELLKTHERAPERRSRSARGEPKELLRRARLGDLTASRGHFAAALVELEPALTRASSEPGLRWRAGRSALLGGDAARASRLIGALEDVSAAHGGWFALHGRLRREAGDPAAAEASFSMALSLDPLSEDVACEGALRARGAADAPPPADRSRRELCEAARALPRD
jgi:hypothetical protein